MRISAKRLNNEIRSVHWGRFDFDSLERLLLHTMADATTLTEAGYVGEESRTSF